MNRRKWQGSRQGDQAYRQGDQLRNFGAPQPGSPSKPVALALLKAHDEGRTLLQHEYDFVRQAMGWSYEQLRDRLAMPGNGHRGAQDER